MNNVLKTIQTFFNDFIRDFTIAYNEINALEINIYLDDDFEWINSSGISYDRVKFLEFIENSAAGISNYSLTPIIINEMITKDLYIIICDWKETYYLNNKSVTTVKRTTIIIKKMNSNYKIIYGQQSGPEN